jgi:hypothetical protein
MPLSENNKTLHIAEAVALLGAEKQDFQGAHVAPCCGSPLGKGNAFYAIFSGGDSDEVEDECCTRCLKRFAYYRKHQHDNFEPQRAINADTSP